MDFKNSRIECMNCHSVNNYRYHIPGNENKGENVDERINSDLLTYIDSEKYGKIINSCTSKDCGFCDDLRDGLKFLMVSATDIVINYSLLSPQKNRR